MTEQQLDRELEELAYSLLRDPDESGFPEDPELMTDEELAQALLELCGGNDPQPNTEDQ